MVCVGSRGVAPDEFAWDVFALFFMSVLACCCLGDGGVEW
jgi:hypothetical protein